MIHLLGLWVLVDEMLEKKHHHPLFQNPKTCSLLLYKKAVKSSLILNRVYDTVKSPLRLVDMSAGKVPHYLYTSVFEEREGQHL